MTRVPLFEFTTKFPLKAAFELEMMAMPKIPTRVLGVLLSLDPVLAALAGFVLLNEHLSWLQWTAIGCIMIASAGSASGSRAEALAN